MKPSVFVIIPVHNEQGAIADVVSELVGQLEGVSSSLQVLVVNDGSTDGTRSVLTELMSREARLQTIELELRSGQATAIQAGLDRIPASADLVILMDGDGQDNPANLPRMMDMVNHGEASMVTGWRQVRAENRVRTVPSRIANKMLASATRLDIHDFGSPLKVVDADLARRLQLRGDMHRFIPALGRLAGATVVEVPVVQRPRTTGVAKYGLSRTGKVLMDTMALYFILRFADRPMRVFGTVGAWLMVIGLALLTFVGVDKIVNDVPMTSRPLFLISIFFMLAAVIVIVNGLTAELMSFATFRRDQLHSAYTIRSTKAAPNSPGTKAARTKRD